jgi:hypothetical protein
VGDPVEAIRILFVGSENLLGGMGKLSTGPLVREAVVTLQVGNETEGSERRWAVADLIPRDLPVSGTKRQ